MRLVDDDGIYTVGVVFVEPSHKALHRCADNGFVVGVRCALFDAAGQVLEIFQRLLHQLFTVGQNQNMMVIFENVPADIFRENAGLAESRCNGA